MCIRDRFLEQPEHGRRTIVISDIHAHRRWLERLLTKIDFSEKDMLIILGDMIEKGPESLETIRYIMQLCEKHTVYPMMGNVDLWRIEMLLAEDGSLDKELYETNERMRQYWKNTFFQDLCKMCIRDSHSHRRSFPHRRSLAVAAETHQRKSSPYIFYHVYACLLYTS